MIAIGIKALKNRLSEYLRLVAAGETVLVTDRDKVVAELVPPGPGRRPFVSDALLADAVREGWIVPSVSPSGGLPARRPVLPLAELLRGLERDRGER